MDTRSKLVALALLSAPGLALAGYASMSVPAGFSGTGASMAYKATANDSFFAGGARSFSTASMNIGGRAVTMPVAYRWAANAGTMAARTAFMNPWLFAGVAVGSAVYNWYHDSGFILDNGVWKKSDSSVCTVSPCYKYRINMAPWGGYNFVSPWFTTPEQACQWWVPELNAHPQNSYTWYQYQGAAPRITGVCYIGKGTVGYPISETVSWAYQWDSAAPSAPSYIPVTQSEFESALSPKPIPDALPPMLPDPLPVELPVINPSPDAVPVAQPKRVPMGEPQPVPNTNPQQWKTPAVDIVPSPTSSDPFRVDIQPRDIIKDSAAPVTEGSVPATPPAGQTEAPVTPDLCEKNPEILACQKINLGTLDPTAVPNENRSFAITPDSGWGASNGTCPPPRTVQLVSGLSVAMPFDLLCQFATGIRSVVIGLAWLTAALAFIGFARKD